MAALTCARPLYTGGECKVCSQPPVNFFILHITEQREIEMLSGFITALQWFNFNYTVCLETAQQHFYRVCH